MAGGFSIALTGTIMTAGIITAHVDHFRIVVIEYSDYPVSDIVALTAIQCGWYVRGTLTGGNHIIVTTRASTQCLIVIKSAYG
jgi:hypothetical protein